MLSCIDITKTGDISGKAVWTFKGLERTISTPAVKDGIIYAADYTGRLFALDAKTGKDSGSSTPRATSGPARWSPTARSTSATKKANSSSSPKARK